jgi:hypothetical protein
MLRRSSHGHRGGRGRSYGHGYLGQRDRRDRFIMTAHRLCKSVFCGNRGAARVGGCFIRTRVQAGESLADTVGPALKVRGHAAPFKTTCRALVWDFAFLSSSSSSSRTRPLRSEIFRIRDSTAACASSPPKTLLPRCRIGRAPMFPASSSSVLSRRANFLHSPTSSSGGFPATSLCRGPQGVCGVVRGLP